MAVLYCLVTRDSWVANFFMCFPHAKPASFH